MKWIVLDWETVSGVDLKAVGAYRYAQDPTTDILCAALGNKNGRALWHPGLPCPPKIHQAIAEGWVFVAHNTQFERVIWQNIATPEYGWPECPPLEQWHDTMSRALQLALPAGLEDVLRVLKLPVQKDTEGSKLTIGLSKVDKKGRMPARTPEILQRVYTYCEADIDGEVALHDRLGWLPECEREPWIIAQEMNDRGIHLDMELVEAMQSVVDQAIPPLAARFREITGLNFGQVQKIKAWVQGEGVPIANLSKRTLAELLGDTEAEDDDIGDGEDAEGEHVELPSHVREALHIRQLIGSASIKKLKSMSKVVCFDGRARGLMVYHGTTPGRQTAKLLQPHNFPRPTLKVDGEGHDPETLVGLIKQRDPDLLEMAYGKGAVEIVVSGLRHTIAAPPGSRLMSGDYSGIQARVVLALAGEHEKTAMMAAGLDVYCDMASRIYRRTITKKDAVERQIGKASVLGLGFQGGGGMFHEKMAPKETREFCDEVVQVYRREWAPGVPLLWYGLQDAAVDTVWYGTPHESHGIVYRLEDEWLTAEIPNGKGSKLWYKNPRPVKRAMPWDETDVRRAFDYNVQKQGQWITRHAFGGQLTENVVMKIEREIMEDAKVRLKRYGYPIVLEVHDEALAEMPLGKGSLEEYQRILEDVERWTEDMRIPIQVDCWEGTWYRK